MKELNNIFDEKKVDELSIKFEESELQERVLNKEDDFTNEIFLENEGERKTFYLDDNNNFTSPEEATRIIVQIFDKDGKMIREVWGSNEKQISHEDDEEEQLNYLYVDEDGNEVEQEKASFLIIKKYVKDELISEDKFPLANQNNNVKL